MILDAILFLYNYGIILAFSISLVATCLRLLFCVVWHKHARVGDILTALKSLGWHIIYSAMPLTLALTSLAYLPLEKPPYQLPALVILLSVILIGDLAVIMDCAVFTSELLAMPETSRKSGR